MKYFVMSDIHGDYLAMKNGLKKAGYDKTNPNHQIVSIGDHFGRAETGLGSYGIYEYLVQEYHANKPICIRGNHEDIFMKMMSNGAISQLDRYNGEDKTFWSFYWGSDAEKYANQLPKNWRGEEPFEHRNDYMFDGGYISGSKQYNIAIFKLSPFYKELMAWMVSMPNYFETKNYVFTHGWLPGLALKGNREEYASYNDYVQNLQYSYDYKDLPIYAWENARWANVNGVEGTPACYIKHKHAFDGKGWNKWLVVGHWHAFVFNPKFAGLKEKEIYNRITDVDCTPIIDEENKVIFCDQCTAYSHHIDVVVLEDDPK